MRTNEKKENLKKEKKHRWNSELKDKAKVVRVQEWKLMQAVETLKSVHKCVKQEL